MSVFIRILGPQTAKTHLGTRRFWTVQIFNAHLGRTVDLTPDDERSSLGHDEAIAIARNAASVTGFQIREFNVVVKHSVEYVEVDEDSA